MSSPTKPDTKPTPAPNLATDDEHRNQRRTLIGTVTSTKMQSTLTVQVERTFRHRKYGKFMRERKRYHVHAADGSANLGDLVEIAATRPISKLKRWRLVRVVSAAVERGAEVSAIAGTSK
jgi:small subunit ribosomal protein S17